MTEAKFKVGDRVRCIRDGIGAGAAPKTGCLYTVQEVGYSGGRVLRLAEIPESQWYESIFELEEESKQSALSTQVGGSHYKNFAIQPSEFIHRNGIGFLEGNVIKYVTRYRAKNGLQDLQKAKHYIEMLIEMETKK